MHSNRQEDLGYNKQDVINAFIQVGKPRLQQADVINAFKQVGRSQLQQTGCNQCI